MEIWKAIPGYEAYEVSNLGNVRRWNLARTKAREITPTTYSNAPYKMFTVSKHGKSGKMYLHRVLATLFVPNDNPKENNNVCFKDSNIANTDIQNLYWSNQKARMGVRKSEGKYLNGKGNARLTEEIVREIRKQWQNRLWEPCMTQAQMAKHYSVHPWTIYACLKGITWKHIK